MSEENPYNQYDGPVSENPGMADAIIDQENTTLRLNNLEENLKNQYESLEDLGIDYLKEYDGFIPDEIFEKMIAYINDNYLNIAYIEQVSNSSNNLRLVTKTIYEILFVDFVKFFIPNIMKFEDLEDPDELKKYATQNLKNLLLEISSKNIEEFQEIGQTNLVYKFAFAIDIFDSDLTDFRTEFLLPVISNNYDIIKINLE